MCVVCVCGVCVCSSVYMKVCVCVFVCVVQCIGRHICWRTFKYFIILIVSKYYILCISWIIKCFIICSFVRSLTALSLCYLL